jgi:hypothetical protein
VQRLIPPFVPETSLHYLPHLIPTPPYYLSSILRPHFWVPSKADNSLSFSNPAHLPSIVSLLTILSLSFSSPSCSLVYTIYITGFYSVTHCNLISICFLQGAWWIPSCQIQWPWPFCSTLGNPLSPLSPWQWTWDLSVHSQAFLLFPPFLTIT